jgi:hypothetical protein
LIVSYGDECDLKMQMYWFVATDVLGGVAGIRPSPGQGQPISGAGRWFPPFSCMMFMFWNDLLMVIFYEIFVEWWNDDEVFDWILDDCWNDYEMSIEFLMNVETITKMLMFWNELFEVDILLCCDEY